MAENRITVNVDGLGQPLTFPEGTPQTVITEVVRRNLRESGAASMPMAPDSAYERAKAISGTTTAEKIAGNPATRFGMGITDAVFGGPAQLGTAIGGFAVDKLTNNPDPYAAFISVNDFRDKYKSLESAGMHNRAGESTTTNTAGLMGNMAVGAGGMARYGLPQAMVPRIIQGAGQGFTLGALAPTDDTENYAMNKALQVGAGTLMGGVAPPAFGALADGLRTATGATSRYAGELLNKTAGADRKAITEGLLNYSNTPISAIRRGYEGLRGALSGPSGGKSTAVPSMSTPAAPPNYRRGTPAVYGESFRPGSTPDPSNPRNLTAGEVVAKEGNAEFANLNKKAAGYARTENIATNTARDKQIVDDLTTVFKADKVDDLVQLRKTNSQSLFEQAKGSDAQVDTSKTVSLIDDLIADDPQNTVLVNALNSIKNGLMRSEPSSVRGIPTSRVSTVGSRTRQLGQESPSASNVPNTNVSDLISSSNGMRKHLDDAAGDSAIEGRIFGLIASVKRQLQDDIGDASDEYATGMRNYRRDSEAVNQAIFGRDAINKLNPAANNVEADQALRSNAMADLTRDPAAALRNIDLPKVSGGLDDILSKEQMLTWNSLTNQLGATTKNQKLAGPSNAMTDSAMGEIGVGTFPNPLNRILMVTNRILGDIGSETQVKTLAQVGRLSPKEQGLLMQKFNPDERILFSQLLGFTPVAAGVNTSDNVPSEASALVESLRGNQ